MCLLAKTQSSNKFSVSFQCTFYFTSDYTPSPLPVYFVYTFKKGCSKGVKFVSEMGYSGGRKQELKLPKLDVGGSNPLARCFARR